MVGGINLLAPIVTILYLFTYATIEYAYFSMAMTFDIQINKEKRFMAIASQLNGLNTPDSGNISRSTTIQLIGEGSHSGVPLNGDGDGDSLSVSLLKIDSDTPFGGRSTSNVSTGADTLPPPSPTPSQQQTLVGYGAVQTGISTQHIKIKRRQSTQSDSSTDSEGESNLYYNRKKVAPVSPSPVAGRKIVQQPRTTSPALSDKPKKTIRQLMAAVSDDDDDEDNDHHKKGRSSPQNKTAEQPDNGSGIFRFDTSSEHHHSAGNEQPAPNNLTIVQSQVNDNGDVHERLLNDDPEMAEIACKQSVWYLRYMNRWIVLLAAILKFILMFAIAWQYAAMSLVTFVVFYIFIGRTNPGYYPGVSEFIFCNWIKDIAKNIAR